MTQLLTHLEPLAAAADWPAALAATIAHFGADNGTIHHLGADGHLHLTAASAGIPPQVVEIVRLVPVGKGMAGLAAERREPVSICNIQTDTSGDARPGARATGLDKAIALPMFGEADRVAGVLGIANRAARTFTPEETAALIEVGRLLARYPPAA